MSYQPKHPAAFINAIAEEGTKEEAIEYLWRQWDETCDLIAQRDRLVETLRTMMPWMARPGMKHLTLIEANRLKEMLANGRALLSEIEKDGPK